MSEIASKPKNDVFGLVALIILAIGNTLHLVVFLSMLSEQIQTGWGGSTNIEMGALYIWLFEVLVMIGAVVSIVLYVVSLVRGDRKSKAIANASLIVALIAQVVLTNIFIFY